MAVTETDHMERDLCTKVSVEVIPLSKSWTFIRKSPLTPHWCNCAISANWVSAFPYKSIQQQEKALDNMQDKSQQPWDLAGQHTIA